MSIQMDEVSQSGTRVTSVQAQTLQHAGGPKCPSHSEPPPRLIPGFYDQRRLEPGFKHCVNGLVHCEFAVD